MTLENAVRLWAGFVVLLSLALYLWVSPWWLLLTAFAGFNMVQSSFTGLCPAQWMLKKLFFKDQAEAAAPAGRRSAQSSRA
ncbi:MAG TPA: DUF2892 domain-containing protein [candidate division Zixibacteria bacterium]|nr:DUF2892 domain-containing protein [candidate division Zixibacteria bacterium]MDD4917466.1 DUF2892 domain-containing protein [candidate division Zixibacteria bacterium]MDM7972319.1 DUF2892 domain-containing protein [candidate division Zixibacteria bacterium]HOD66857.1 DUF2892 domain-containing protein [candidate division Zixibacteria bacterium]HOZ06805.1 DUF2892 domain-containing protein [candidate division Zixibacteria bacterium]